MYKRCALCLFCSKMYSFTSWFCVIFVFGWVSASLDPSLLLNSYPVTPDDGTCDESLGMNKGCNAMCTGLKMCIQGQLTTVDCKAQTGRPYCNQNTSECVSTPVICPAPPDSFRCPIPDGVFPDPLDCTQFHHCLDNIDNPLRCLSGVFLPTDPPKCAATGTCYVFSTASFGLCRGKVGKLVGHPLNSILFVKCNEDYPVLGVCQGKNIQFDSATLSCQYKCPGGGFFPHEQLNLYYICTKDATGRYTAKVEACAPGLIFSERWNTCVLNI